ncbi:MAG: division/cell wall cluster transcriptional repressor MraZ [Methanocellales archaeon]|nr:division/cell wall cluster transcriptional repressor MraZ [Methanocellales archaeon]
MASTISIDGKNRIVIPKDMIEKLGLKDSAVLVDLGNHIGIYPAPSDPFKELHGSFNTPKTFKELRKIAEELIIREASTSR